MSARPQDYISASGFTIRDDVAGSANKLSISGSSVSVPVPAFLTVGSRIKVTTKPTGLVAYYRITTATLGALQTGVSLEWIDVGVAPATVALTAGDTVEFVPYATGKAAIPEQNVKVGRGHSIELLDYFQMIGGRDKDLTFFARPGGAFAKVSTSGSALVIAGNSVGTMSVTVTAQDKSQGRYAQSFTIVVAQANRAPVSSKAIGNPTIAVGATVTYDLNDYFTDPDGDALAFSSGSINHNPLGTVAGAVVAISIPGSTLTLTGLIQGSTRFTVGASDGDLTISQQVNVTVPANQRPIIDQHIPGLAVALAGQPITVPLDAYFTDPDGTALAYLIQFEQGDPTKQYEQELWYPHTQSGSSQLAMDSEFAYPPGSVAPWGTGTPWIVPAGTDFTMRGTYGGTLTTHRLTTRASANATWHTGTRKVRLTLTFTTALPTGPSTTHLLALLGKGADVCWSAVAGQTLTLAPGESPGHRTLYIEAYDAGGLAASQFAVITLGRAPSLVKGIPNALMFTGADIVINLDEHFTDPDGDKLDYALVVDTDNVVALSLIPKQIVTPGAITTSTELHIHALTATQRVDITVRANDTAGLSLHTTFSIEITASRVAVSAPLISDSFIERSNAIQSEEALNAFVLDQPQAELIKPFAFRVWNPINRNYTNYGAKIWDYSMADWLIIETPDDDHGRKNTNVIRLIAPLAGETIVNWKDRAQLNFAQNIKDNGITATTKILAGDRFYFGGNSFDIYNDPYVVTEVLPNSPGYIDDSQGKRLVYDLRLTNRRGLSSPIWGTPTTIPGLSGNAIIVYLPLADRWSINWYPRLTSNLAPVKLLLPDIVPVSSTALVEYVENNIGRITYENAQEAATILGMDVNAMLAVGVNINLFTVTYEILAVSIRYYRNRPLFFELNLQARLFGSTTVPTDPGSTPDPANGTPARATITWADASPKVALPPAQIGQSYSFDFTTHRVATDSQGETVRYAASGLPAGLSMARDGVISGTPTGNAPASGTKRVVVIASAVGVRIRSSTEVVLLSVLPASLITWADASPKVAIPVATISQAFTFDYTTHRLATSDTGSAVTYAATGLPTGLSMASDGVISGTPTAGRDTYPVVVTASSGTGTGAGVDVTDGFDLLLVAASSGVVWASASASNVGTADWFKGDAFVVRDVLQNKHASWISIGLGPLSNTTDWPDAARPTAGSRASAFSPQFTDDASASPLVGLLATSTGVTSARITQVLRRETAAWLTASYPATQQLIFAVAGDSSTNPLFDVDTGDVIEFEA